MKNRPTSPGIWRDGTKLVSIIHTNDVKGGRLVVDLGSGMYAALDCPDYTKSEWKKAKQLFFWHGAEARLIQFAKDTCIEHIGNYYYIGTLEFFAELWGKPFIVAETYIAITHKNSWGQC